MTTALAFGSAVPHPLFWLIAPFLAWAATSVQLMILALAATRAKSIFILEDQLVQCAGLSKEEHAEIGVYDPVANANVTAAMMVTEGTSAWESSKQGTESMPGPATR
jgi:hypothetical protein